MPTPAEVQTGTATADASITTAAGKVYWLSIGNAHASETTTVQLNDSTDDTGTDLWVGAVPPEAVGHFLFSPPIKFATGVRIDIQSGTVTATVGFVI